MPRDKFNDKLNEEQEERREYVKNIGIEYRYGCYEEKRADSCHLLGEYFEAIDQNFAKSLSIFRENCQLRKNPASCFKYGKYLLAGRECEPSTKLMMRPMTIACEGNIPQACRFLSLLHMNGDIDRAPNPKLAEAVMKKACEMEDPEACWLLSTWYIGAEENFHIDTKGAKEKVDLTKKLGLPKNMNEALKYGKLACDLNVPQSCANVARMYRLGDGITKDPDQAQQYLDRAKALIDIIRNANIETGFTG